MRIACVMHRHAIIGHIVYALEKTNMDWKEYIDLRLGKTIYSLKKSYLFIFLSLHALLTELYNMFQDFNLVGYVMPPLSEPYTSTLIRLHLGELKNLGPHFQCALSTPPLYICISILCELFTKRFSFLFKCLHHRHALAHHSPSLWLQQLRLAVFT